MLQSFLQFWDEGCEDHRLAEQRWLESISFGMMKKESGMIGFSILDAMNHSLKKCITMFVYVHIQVCDIGYFLLQQ